MPDVPFAATKQKLRQSGKRQQQPETREPSLLADLSCRATTTFIQMGQDRDLAETAP